MKNYIDLLKDIIDNGHDHDDRTGVGRRSVIVRQLRFDMDDGFPLLTTKKMGIKTIIHELLWFISGDIKTDYLDDNGVKIWNLWTTRNKDVEEMIDSTSTLSMNDKVVQEAMEHTVDSVGPIYGPNWRDAPQSIFNKFWPQIEVEDIPKDKLKKYRAVYATMSKEDREQIPEKDFFNALYRATVDQLNDLVIGLRDRPFSSRLIVNAWIPQYIPFEDLSPQENVLVGRGALAPCHMNFQCFVKEGKNGKELSLHMSQRSADVPVGVPYNIAQYALLLHMLAHVSGMKPKDLIITFGDAHIYKNQLDTVRLQVNRRPFALPKLKLNDDVKSIFDFTIDDFELTRYTPHPKINYKVSK